MHRAEPVGGGFAEAVRAVVHDDEHTRTGRRGRRAKGLVDAAAGRPSRDREHSSTQREITTVIHGGDTTSIAPAKPVNAGTPMPRQHHDHNELQLPYKSPAPMWSKRHRAVISSANVR